MNRSTYRDADCIFGVPIPHNGSAEHIRIDLRAIPTKLARDPSLGASLARSAKLAPPRV